VMARRVNACTARALQAHRRFSETRRRAERKGGPVWNTRDFRPSP